MGYKTYLGNLVNVTNDNCSCKKHYPENILSMYPSLVVKLNVIVISAADE